jgi:hypothetical protein
LHEKKIRDGINSARRRRLGVYSAEGQDINDFAAEQFTDEAKWDRSMTARGYDGMRAKLYKDRQG